MPRRKRKNKKDLWEEARLKENDISRELDLQVSYEGLTDCKDRKLNIVQIIQGRDGKLKGQNQYCEIG